MTWMISRGSSTGEIATARTKEMKMFVMTMMLSREVMGEEHLEAVPVDKLPPPKVPLQVASHHCHSSDNCAPQKIISPSHKMNHRLPNTRVLLWEVWTTLFKIASPLHQNRFPTIDIEDITITKAKLPFTRA